MNTKPWMAAPLLLMLSACDNGGGHDGGCLTFTASTPVSATAPVTDVILTQSQAPSPPPRRVVGRRFARLMGAAPTSAS